MMMGIMMKRKEESAEKKDGLANCNPTLEIYLGPGKELLKIYCSSITTTTTKTISEYRVLLRIHNLLQLLLATREGEK